MRYLQPVVVVVLLLLGGAARGAESEPIGLRNERMPLPNLVSGGAPDSAALARAAERGFRTLVDLRTEAERDPLLEQRAVDLGLEVVAVPVGGVEDLTQETIEAVALLLDDEQKHPLLLICASGNRSGAVLALEARWIHGTAPSEALELGLAGGLTRLEPAVRELLGLPVSPSPSP